MSEPFGVRSRFPEIVRAIAHRRGWTMETAFYAGRILPFLARRGADFSARRFFLGGFHSARMLAVVAVFPWFGWGDFIVDLSFLAIILGAHQGALEETRTDPRPDRTARMKLLTLSLAALVAVPPLLRAGAHAFATDSNVNVFDAIRVVLAMRTVSQLLRAHRVAIFYRRGVRPLPWRTLSRLEGGLTAGTAAAFVGVNAGVLPAYPPLLFGIILAEFAVSEWVAWHWFRSRVGARSSVAAWFRIFPAATPNFRAIPAALAKGILDAVPGAFFYADRFLLAVVLARSAAPEEGLNVSHYFFLLPFVHSLWRTPFAYARMLRGRRDPLGKRAARAVRAILAIAFAIGGAAVGVVGLALAVPATTLVPLSALPFFACLGLALWLNRYPFYPALASFVRFRLGSRGARMVREFTVPTGLNPEAIVAASSAKLPLRIDRLRTRDYRVTGNEIALAEFGRRISHYSLGRISRAGRVPVASPPAIAPRRGAILPFGALGWRKWIADEEEARRFLEKIRRSYYRARPRAGGERGGFFWRGKKFTIVDRKTFAGMTVHDES